LDKPINIPDAQRAVVCFEPHPYDDLPAALMWQPREPEPSTINEKTIADFTRVVEQYASYMEPTACRSTDVERPSPDGGSLFYSSE